VDAYKKAYFKNLDAPRFIAFISVFVEHVVFTKDPAIRKSSVYWFYHRHLILGTTGLDFYIVLSGFLITWIIMEEQATTGKFNLLYFWLKRCLRIWPLYFLMIFTGLLLVWMARHFAGLTVTDIPPLSWLMTFTLNFYIINHGLAFLYFLVFLWSISVEEQCYVLWGLIMRWFKKSLPWLCFTLIAVSVIFRIFTVREPLNIYFNSLSWVGNYAAGAWLAFLCIRGGKNSERLKMSPKWVIITFYILFLLNIIFYKRIYSHPPMLIFERFTAALFFSFLIFDQSFGNNRIFNLGRKKVFNYLGRISYGLFCYHGLMILAYEKIAGEGICINNPYLVFIVNPIIIFAMTLGISVVSYEYFERPLMSLKRKIPA
jgi:peptidoglycan/LPS O-acetylase OafA/YrhL